MLSIDVRLTLIALMPLPFVSITRQLLRQRHPQAVRGDPGAALRDQRRRRRRRCRACAWSAPTAGGVRDRAVPRGQRRSTSRRNRVLIRLQGAVLSEHDAVSRLRLAAGALARQPRGHPRPDHARRVRRVQRLSGDARLADDRVRLGHQHPAARHGVVEADARGARRRARRSATRTSTAGRPGRGARRRDRDPRPDLRLSRRPTAPVLEHVSPAHRAGPDRRVRRRHRLGQVDADQPAAAAARAAARHGVRRRRRRPRDSARRACAARSASCRRSRSCSPTRSPRTSRSASADRRTCRTARTADGDRHRARRPRSPGWTRTSRTSPRATTRWSASAASRCRAGRSSAPRWRAR